MKKRATVAKQEIVALDSRDYVGILCGQKTKAVEAKVAVADAKIAVMRIVLSSSPFFLNT